MLRVMALMLVRQCNNMLTRNNNQVNKIKFYDFWRKGNTPLA